MPTNDYSKNIIYLSKEQYQTLVSNKTLTVNNQTIVYNDNDIYVTPQAEPVIGAQVDGTSIVTNGIADIPIINYETLGLAKTSSIYGIASKNNGYIYVYRAKDSDISAATNEYKPIVPYTQHQAVYYGLAKLAGTDLANETVTLGTYPDAAKDAIQNMLGISSLISTRETSTATTAHTLNSLFLMNGKLYRATAAIAIGDAVVEGENCEVVKIEDVFVKNTDYAIKDSTGGIVRVGDGTDGITIANSSHCLYVVPSTSTQVKGGAQQAKPIVPNTQHEAVFYGLSKVAGVNLANETVTLGTYPETSKTAIRSLIGAIGTTDYATSTTGGVVLVAGSGLGINSTNGKMYISCAESATVKAGANWYYPIVPQFQHEAAFYGLAKAAGADMASSSNQVGTYTDAAKTAIRSMIGATSNKVIAIQDEQPTDTDTKVWLPETQAAGVQVPTMEDMQNYVQKTDYATSDNAGVIKVGGRLAVENNKLLVRMASLSNIKGGTTNDVVLTPGCTNSVAFYGLAKAAGDTTQSSSENAVGTYTDTAKTAIRTMLSAIGSADYATSSTAGIVKLPASTDTVGGISLANDGQSIYLSLTTDDVIKEGLSQKRAILPYQQHISTFYGLAKAAGDTTQASSSNLVGTYTSEAKSAIQSMLGVESGVSFVENISGTTVSITGEANTRYMCGELSTLSITPPSVGTIDIVFISGSTPTSLTVPNTVQFPSWFDYTSLDANATYEINIMDGIYGAVMVW